MTQRTSLDEMLGAMAALRPSEKLLREAAAAHRHDREASARIIGGALGGMDRGELIGFATVASALYLDLATNETNGVHK